MKFLFAVTALLLAVLIQGSLSAVIDYADFAYNSQHKCAQSCPDAAPDIIKPKLGTSYLYSLKAETVLTPRESQKVTIKGDAVVTFTDRCEASLLLRNVTLDGVDHASKLAGQLEEFPMGFGYYNGKIREVCHQKSDEAWVQNIKKAVISTLQLSSITDIRMEEVDISGRCWTNYFTQQSDKPDETIVYKRKDLYKCNGRHVIRPSSPTTFKQAFHQLFNPMSSDLLCKYVLKNRIVEKVECDEGHYVEVIRKQVHSSKLSLELKSSEIEINGLVVVPTSDWVRQDIALRLSDDTTGQVKHTSRDEVIETLKKLCYSVSGKTAHIESSNIFAKLVDQLKHLSDEGTSSLYDSVKSGNICPSAPKRLLTLFHDASAFAATDSSIVNLVSAYNDKELSKTKAVGYFAILALKAAPKNEGTIQALLPLIKSKSTSRSMLLSVSTLVRRFCDQISDCEANPVVADVVRDYQRRLTLTYKPLDTIVLIKALENINVNSFQVLQSLVNSNNENDIRLAALQALPEHSDSYDLFKTTLLEGSNSNEIRIAAFHKLVGNKKNFRMINNMLSQIDGFSVKNYITTYMNNLKDADAPARKALLPDDISFNEWSSKKTGVTKNILKELGPLALEVDTIFPENSNVTQSVAFRLSVASTDKITNIAEITIRQQGLNKLVGSMIDLFEDKITNAQFNREFSQDLVELLKKLQSKGNALHYNRDQLQFSLKLSGQNVIFVDAIEDLAEIMAMAQQVQELASSSSLVQTKEDAIVGGVLFDNLDFIVPTTTGIPVHYKLNINALAQSNGQVNHDTNKKHLIINRSWIAGLTTSVRFQLADQKVGYEYNGKLALTPNFDVEFERTGKNAVSIKWNLKEDKQVFLKLTQTAKELKQIGSDKQTEVEFAPEFRIDQCSSVMILNYCRKISHVSSPYVEYYITKPESSISALKFDIELDIENPISQSLTFRANALGTPTNYEHTAKLQYLNMFGLTRKAILQLQSPDGLFETSVSISMFNGKTFKVKLDTPEFKVDGKFEKGSDNVKNDVLVQYKWPSSDEMHFVKFQNNIGADIGSVYGGGSSLAQKLNLTWLIESSQLPWLNHRSLVNVKSRHDRLGSVYQDALMEFAYGPTMENLYRYENKLEGTTSVEKGLADSKTVMNAKQTTRYVATDFNLNYGMKEDTRVAIEEGEQVDMTYNVTGTDYSKRLDGEEHFHSEIHLLNKGESLDSKLDANVTYSGEEFAFHGELKKTRARKYEGKFSLEW